MVMTTVQLNLKRKDDVEDRQWRTGIALISTVVAWDKTDIWDSSPAVTLECGLNSDVGGR